MLFARHRGIDLYRADIILPFFREAFFQVAARLVSHFREVITAHRRVLPLLVTHVGQGIIMRNLPRNRLRRATLHLKSSV